VNDGAVPMIHAATAIRPARDDDAQDLYGLVTLCFAQYPGCYLDPHDDMPDLARAGTCYRDTGGGLVVVEDERGRVGACCGIDFAQPGAGELHRLYVRPDMRRRGIAGALIAHCEALARANAAARIVFWSDTRFTDAHRLYERTGYRRTGQMRNLGDISNSVEFFFVREL
jgi:GNAT superfamily N-acetyltransferase